MVSSRLKKKYHKYHTSVFTLRVLQTMNNTDNDKASAPGVSGPASLRNSLHKEY